MDEQPLGPGAEIGPYRLEERIGQGGMATVYLALHTQLQRRVALKVLRDDMAVSEAARRRFVREAQAAARLKHPNLVQVHEVLEADDRVFLVLEHIDGQPIDARTLDRRRAVQLLRKVALAMDHAHAHGVIHRDLKPGNILVDVHGEPHVVDFGLAHLEDSQSRLTRTGSQIGTPMYMAPEQVAGQPEQIGPRTDIYALGAILYELLTGRPPHTGTTVAEIYSKILNEDTRAPSTLRPDLHRELETICLKALSKEPARRYATAAEMADDLQRWLGGEPILARPPSLIYRVRRKLGRHRTILAAVVAGLAVGGVIALVVLPRFREARRKRDEAERALAAEKRREESLRVLRDHWNRIVFAKTELHRGQVDPQQARRDLRATIDAVPVSMPQGLYIRARGRFHLDELDGAERDLLEAIRKAGDFEPAWALLARIHLERFRRSRIGTQQQVPGAETNVHLLSAKDALARVQNPTGWAERWGLLRTRDDDVAETLTRVLAISHLEGDNDRARTILEKALEEYKSEEYYVLLGAFRRLPERLDAYTKAIELAPGYLTAWFHRAIAHTELDDQRSALRDLHKVIELDPGDALAYASRGAVKEHLDDFAGGDADCTRALEMNPDLDWVYYNRAVARAKLGRFPDALRDLDESIRRIPSHQPSFSYRAHVRDRLGDESGAVADFTRALEMDPEDLPTRMDRAHVLARRRQCREALADLDFVVGRDPKRAPAWCKRGICHAALEDNATAIADFTRAIELDPKYVDAWYNRGVSHAQLRRLDEAISDYTKAIELAPKYHSAYANRGGIRFYRREFREAAEDFEAALKHAPEDWTLRPAIRELLEQARNP